MKYKYIIISILISLIIITIQISYFYSLHQNFIIECEKSIEKGVFLSIDNEVSHRTYNNPNIISEEPLETMDKDRRDSILKIHPLPPPPPKYNIEELIDRGIIRTTAEFGEQYNRDLEYEKGIRPNIALLDSLYIAKSEIDIPHTFVIIDNIDSTKTYSNQEALNSYTYKSKPFYLGLKARLTILLYYDIPLSLFIKDTLLAIISSTLLLCFALVLIFVQIRVIRQSKRVAEQIQNNINGTIHDLKTPLSGVIMTLNLAKSTIEDQRIKDTFSLSLASTRNLISNIDSLLSVARKDNTLHREEITTSGLFAIIGEVVSDLSNIYANKEHTIEVNNSLSSDTKFSADRLYLENIIRNLLDNSIKYALSGVMVKLSIESTVDSIKFTVEDNGYGIAKKHQRKVFHHFYRVEHSGVAQRGYGIGLSQVKQMVKKHGGEISLDSKEGKGTKFTFTIPN